MKRILMIAAHYPPMKGSSGLQRSLKFSEYLPEFGWQPIVLTVNPRVFEQTSDEQLNEIPTSVVVERAFAFDAKRHLSIAGRYPRFLSLPDRWSSWWLGGVPAGRRLIRRFKPDVIWSTFPIATAHMIGHSLSRWSGLPWIADFRDSMTEVDYPVDPAIRKSVLAVERKTVSVAARCVFTAPSARKMYAARYPDRPAHQWVTINNGFDEPSFAKAASLVDRVRRSSRTVLLHSGLLDPSDRNPENFFGAIQVLKKSGAINSESTEFRLRASGFDDLYAEMLRRYGIDDVVTLEPALPYADALAEMMTVDALLLFQGAGCNHQIPAKAYEYFRSGTPVFGLVDPAGDTAGLLREAGIQSIAALESAEKIRENLKVFIESLREKSAIGVPFEQASLYSRYSQTGQLSALCDGLA